MERYQLDKLALDEELCIPADTCWFVDPGRGRDEALLRPGRQRERVALTDASQSARPLLADCLSVGAD
jgi:hypothetical protein